MKLQSLLQRTASKQRAPSDQKRCIRQPITSQMLVAALAIGASGLASAQASSGVTDGWQFEVTPYLWAAGLKGDAELGNLPKINLDKSFSDILSKLDFGAMGSFEARKDRWGFLFDGLYMKLSDSATATGTSPNLPGASLTVNADATIKESILSWGVAYRVLNGSTPVDLIGGVRYVKIDVDASIGARLYDPVASIGATVSRSGDKSFSDPYIGVRVVSPIADRWALMGYADTSGGGQTSTWQVAVGANYAYSKEVSVKLGYRYLNIGYDKDAVHIDTKMSGPYIGVGFRF